MKRLIFVFILAGISFISCERGNHKKIIGAWVIDQAYYNNEPVIWDLYHNSIDLNGNHTCELPPISSRNPGEEFGQWELSNDNDYDYLKINTENRIFNRTFKIHDLREVKDSVSWGFLMKMTLTADSLKLDCTKALYK